MHGGLVYDRDLSIKQSLVAQSPDMVAQRQRMHAALALQPGEHALEIGCGNGFMASEMARSVAPAGHITGADISAAMVAMAGALCEGLVNVEFIEADAADLPFADNSFDVVTLTQTLCLVSDVEAAIGELFRVLKPGGRAVMLETDWDTLVWNSSAPRLMDKVMAIYKEAYVDARLPRKLSRLLKQAGFAIRSRQQFAMVNWTYEPDTFSGHQLDFTRALLASHPKLSRGELEAWLQSVRDVAEADEYFFCLNRYIFSIAKP